MGSDLILKSETEKISVETKSDQPSKEIDVYYNGNERYGNTGFVAYAEIDCNQTYDVQVKWASGIITNTGLKINHDTVEYSLESDYEFEGILLVSQPEYDCYVCQNKDMLFWYCGEDFSFDKDGKTCFQFQLWYLSPSTNQNAKVSNNIHWDNREFVFEEFEIEPWNSFRVAKMNIPSFYSIIEVITGCYKDDGWIWKDNFRPIVSILQ